MHEWNFVFVSLSYHKNYNFLDCDWFKKLLFSTNSLAKLLSDSSISQLRSKLKIKSTNLYCRATLDNLRLLCKSFNAIFPFFITWLFFFSQKLKFLWLIGNKISCRPIRAVIILVINNFSDLLSLVWLQTELDSTQSYYHYLLQSIALASTFSTITSK